MHLFRDPQQLVRGIIIANVAVFIVSLVLKPTFSSVTMNPLTFLAPDGRSLLALGATGTVPIDGFGRWWSLLSANYLHGGVLHIFFNMMALRQLAPFVTREFGTSRMFVIYTVGGVVGFWVSYVAGVRFTIGASAAVCSLIGAALFYGKSRGDSYGQAIYRQVGGWALGIFVFGLLVPGINNWGHGGGILAGILLGFSLGYQDKSRERLVHKSAAVICLVVTVAILAWAVASGGYLIVTSGR
jgi:rhomboid protease GluP